MKIDFTKPQVVVSVGKPESGKSNSTKYFILKNAVDNKIFKFGIVFSRTKFNDDYNYIPKQFIITRYQPHILHKYMKSLEKIKKKTGKIPPNFVIIDDHQGILNRNDEILINFISSHRHYSSSCFINFQYLYGASPTLRECTTLAILFNSKGKRTINGLFENFGQLFDSYEEFKDYFLECTKEKHVAMLFISKIDDIENNYLQFKAPDMTKHKNIKLQY